MPMVFHHKVSELITIPRRAVVAGGQPVRAANEDNGEGVDVGLERDWPEPALGGQVADGQLRRLCEQWNPGRGRQAQPGKQLVSET